MLGLQAGKTHFMILIDKYLLAGGTLDISQNSEIIPDTSKACQNLEKSRRRTLEVQ